jgi:maleate isomerase
MTGGPILVGVVTPHMAPGPEVELPAMTHGRVIAVLHRTVSSPATSQQQSPTAPPTHAALHASTGPAALGRAAATFTDKTLAAVAHASTTTGYVLGHRGEAALVERLSQRFGVPAVAGCAAAAAALRTNGVGRAQLVHPPWFDDEFDPLGVAYFRDHGIDAVATRATGLPENPARIRPQHVIDWVEEHIEDQAEAVFLAGNGFRTAEAVDELELRTGRLVLAANQAMLWGILAATATRWDITGYGRLFER